MRSFKRLIWGMWPLPLVRSAGAGHTLRGRYHVYGEGAISHVRAEDCTHFSPGLRKHPMIVRSEYSSFWAYVRSEIANWWAQYTMAHLDTAEFRAGRFATRPRWIHRVGPVVYRVVGRPWQSRAEVRAPILPEQSIYGVDDE